MELIAFKMSVLISECDKVLNMVLILEKASSIGLN
jgi:hypothetical protein